MENYEIGTAWRYHNGTKHPNGGLLDRAHIYHPSMRPTPFKVYADIPRTSLCPWSKQTGVSALEAVSTTGCTVGTQAPDMGLISNIIYFSCGITKSIDFGPPVGRIDFRAASCTGALYHIEAYLVCSGMAGLGAGVYYYEPKGNKLCLLRKGDYRKVIVEATAGEPFVSHCSAVLVFTDVFARNSIKYQSREYRHAFWDGGTIISNAMAVSSACRIQHKLLMGFWDEKISDLLGIDGRSEAAIALLALGDAATEPPPVPPMVKAPEAPLPEYSADFPAISQMHEASSLAGQSEVELWRTRAARAGSQWPPATEGQEAFARGLPLEETIIRRGSTRKFSHESIMADHLMSVIRSSTRGVSCDFYLHGPMCDPYIIANTVDGLKQGSYFYDRSVGALASLQEGEMRDVSGHLGLDQHLAHDAAATVFLMVDLQRVLEILGNRGYRVAQMDAAITAGKMYLAAYSLGMGATGLTFYDDEVSGFFSPHAERKNAMFMLALGKKEQSR